MPSGIYQCLLSNRIDAIYSSNEYQVFNRLCLVDSSCMDLNLYGDKQVHISMSTGNVIGGVFESDSKQYHFIGCDVVILDLIFRQNFSEIMRYRCSIESECVEFAKFNKTFRGKMNTPSSGLAFVHELKIIE